MNEETEFSSSLKNIFEKESLKWIFVGGKGGVGKTTCSCSLAVLLAKVRKSVLLVSTDPAHNLSDTFEQKFTHQPSKVDGYTNLYAMEVDPALSFEETMENSELNVFLRNMIGSLPGLDEAIGYVNIIRLMEEMDFSCIIFDTAPTGHTLRLLSFPNVFENFFTKAASLKRRLGTLFDQVFLLLGLSMRESIPTITEEKMESILSVMRLTNARFADPDHTTFVCVCIPEFLSVYETERLIQELSRLKIPTDNIIVNQIMIDAECQKAECRFCCNRKKLQDKHLRQIEDLYGEFHLTKLPLLDNEIRGIGGLTSFSKYLLEPCVV